MAAGAHRVFLLLILLADLKGTHSIQYVCMAKVTGLVVMLGVTVINNVCVCHGVFRGSGEIKFK